jgi:hypothetical protein
LCSKKLSAGNQINFNPQRKGSILLNSGTEEITGLQNNCSEIMKLISVFCLLTANGCLGRRLSGRKGKSWYGIILKVLLTEK